MLFSMVQTYVSVDKSMRSIQMKATEQYFPVVLFITLYKVVLTFETVDTILAYDNSVKAIEQYFPSCSAVYYAVQGGSNF